MGENNGDKLEEIRKRIKIKDITPCSATLTKGEKGHPFLSFWVPYYWHRFVNFPGRWWRIRKYQRDYRKRKKVYSNLSRNEKIEKQVNVLYYTIGQVETSNLPPVLKKHWNRMLKMNSSPGNELFEHRNKIAQEILDELKKG